MKFIAKYGLPILLSYWLASCERDDQSGAIPTPTKTYTTLVGSVLHHEEIIPYARVFVKYNAKEFPGFDTSVYDISTAADSMAKFEFDRLVTGNHYLYGMGYDASLRDSVYGGIPIALDDKLTIIEINVPVTE